MKGKIFPILSVLFLLVAGFSYWFYKDQKSVSVYLVNDSWEPKENVYKKIMKKEEIDLVKAKLNEGIPMQGSIELGNPDRYIKLKDSDLEYRIWFEYRSDSFIFREINDSSMHRVNGAMEFNSIVK